MKQQISTTLKNFLLTGAGGDQTQFAIADCLTISLYNGSIYRFTSWDYDVWIGTRQFSSMGTRFMRGRLQNQRGVQTSQLSITLAPDNNPDLSAGALSNTVPPQNVGVLSLTQALIVGLLNGAEVTLETVYNPVRQSNGTFTDNGWGSIIKFIGVVADATSTRATIKINVASNLHTLEPMWPARLFQTLCPWRLFGPGCKLNADNYAVTGSVTAASTGATIYNGITRTGGYLNAGRCVFTTGPNAGVTRQIKTALGQGEAGNYANEILSDHPVAWYKLAGDATDSSGNGHNGTVHGGVTFGQSSLMVGDTGTSALFDGSTGYITSALPTPNRVGRGVTFEFTISLSAGAAADQPVGIFDTAPHASLKTLTLSMCNNYMAADLAPAFQWWPDRPVISFVQPAIGVPTHFIVVFRGSNTIDLYINGLLYASETVPVNGATSWGPFTIGRSFAPTVGSLLLHNVQPGAPIRYFNGKMQHFAVYNDAFDQNKVTSHFAAWGSTPTAGGAGVFNMLIPFPYAPSVGDQLVAYPGCDKTMNTCDQVFANLANFGGVPFTPPPEQGI